ncbi:MAG: hypothetical protein ACK4SY_09750 [Pyrobaculum sp.]
MLTVYTPGYGLLTDTIMLHGILLQYHEHDIVVTRLNDRYKINIYTDKKVTTAEEVGDLYNSLLNLNLDIEDIDIDISVYGENHVCELRRELPAGVTLRGPGFKVCDTCFALVDRGLIVGVGAIKTPADKILMTFAPHGTMSLRDIAYIWRFGITEVVKQTPPTLAVPAFMLLKYIKAFMPKGEFDWLLWRTDGKKITDFRILPTQKLVKFASTIGKHDACASVLIEVAPDVLAALTEYAIHGGDVRNVIQTLMQAAENKDVAEYCDIDIIAERLRAWKP